jgi:hypothetical protein
MWRILVPWVYKKMWKNNGVLPKIIYKRMVETASISVYGRVISGENGNLPWLC